MSKKYKPISCSFYDELELFALRKMKVEIIFKNEEAKEQRTRSSIKTIETSKGEEFLILANGEKLRLDKLVSVNGKILGKSC